MVQHNTIDHTGVPGVGGSVATDTIWDAAGDLVVGTGANTAARLAIGGTNGMAVLRVSGAVAWALPVGYEFDYIEKTSATSITQTAEASADTIVTGSAVSYDGSTRVCIEFFCPSARPRNDATGQLNIWLFDGSSSIGKMGQSNTPAAQTDNKPFLLRRFLTPSNASHTYSVRGTVGAGSGNVGGGAGGSGNDMPTYIRITKA